MSAATTVRYNFYVILLILALCCLQCIAEERRLLYKRIFQRPLNSYREETAELVNPDDENAELVVHGNIVTDYVIPGNDRQIYEANTMYVADKNGFHVNYTFNLILSVGTRISPTGLKSAAG